MSAEITIEQERVVPKRITVTFRDLTERQAGVLRGLLSDSYNITNDTNKKFGKTIYELHNMIDALSGGDKLWSFYTNEARDGKESDMRPMPYRESGI